MADYHDSRMESIVLGAFTAIDNLFPNCDRLQRRELFVKAFPFMDEHQVNYWMAWNRRGIPDYVH